MQGSKGKDWQALTDDIHSQYNTHLSEENMGRAIRGRSVSRSCCGTPIPSPKTPPPTNKPAFWFHPFLPFHFSPWPSKSLLSTTCLVSPIYFPPSKILTMRVGWAGKPQGKQLFYKHAVPCVTLSPYKCGNQHHHITTNLISLPLYGHLWGIYKQHGETAVVDAGAGLETTT